MGQSLRSTYFSILLSIFLLLLGVTSSAQIASWTYEPQLGSITNPTPNIGTGTSAIINNGGGTITPLIQTGMTGTGCGAQVSGQSAWAFNPFNPGSVNESNGAQFSASTAGYQNIYFTWDQRWSNTAPNTVRLQYTLNGSTWINFAMNGVNTGNCDGSFNGGRFQTNTQGDRFRRLTVNLSSITGANNNPNFGVRIVAAFYNGTTEFRSVEDPAVAASTVGTWRFDNVAFTGTLLPGPTASVMSGTTAICTGGSASIKAVITGGTGPFTLVYSNGSTTFTINNYVSNTNIPVSPTTNTTYSIVSVTNANSVVGTGNSGSAVITVNPLPTVSATNIATCSTGAVTMTGGSPAGGIYSIGSSYSGPSTTFTYSYTNGNGCTKVAGPYTFTRNTAPAIGGQPGTALQTTCQGTAFSPVSVTATGTNATYQWYSNATASNSGGTQLASASEIANGSTSSSYTPSSATVGTLYYYVIVSGACTPAVKSSVSGAFTVLPATVAGTISADQIICGGSLAAGLNLIGQTGNIVKWQRADDFAFTVNVSDIAVTASTLTSANIGTISQTTYFRAVVQYPGCSVAFSNVVTIALNSTTWNGSSWSNGAPDGTKTIVFEGDYISNGDLIGCASIVNSGNVNFQPDDSLVLLNSLTINAGTLTFENNASLVQTNNVANIGNIQYKRDTTPIRKFDYTYWASPVQNQLLINVSPLTRQDKFYWFNATTYAWVNANPNTTTMDPGKGYIFRGPDDYDQFMPVVYHANFNGVPNNGEFTVPIIVNGAHDFNLVGNPYPSAIDADLLMSDSENAAALGTGTTIYLWTHNTAVTNLQYIFSDYATYNYTGGTGTAPSNGANNSVPNGYIAAGQSFFIKGIATGTAKLKNSMRVVGNNDQFFRSASTQKDRFWLEFKNADGFYKQALLGYIDGATNGFDNGYDGQLFESSVSANFYSILEAQKLSIQGRALPFSPSDVVPMGFRSNAAGTYEINLMQTQGLFDDEDIFLEDKLLGVIHNLKDSSYSFETEAGTFDDRFVIHYENGLLGNPNFGVGENDIIVYRDSQNAVVRSNGVILTDVTVYDLNGKKLVGFNNIASDRIAFPFEARQQMFVVQVTTDAGKIVTKKVIL
ncbi:MAG: hypothetical protein EOO50_14635 [Flavobacterium sp.]|uniref:hypothetical protein n=1 Tax=Flavobacterium sp. TaxID=239 RepID=UPI0011FA91C8|nr:hypothetical protein [Flavobacterium sp.]RZJ65200.1 MAG: hypothetical protein EOO50_14635 [Flavobacterium sp.]